MQSPWWPTFHADARAEKIRMKWYIVVCCNYRLSQWMLNYAVPVIMKVRVVSGLCARWIWLQKSLEQHCSQVLVQCDDHIVRHLTVLSAISRWSNFKNSSRSKESLYWLHTYLAAQVNSHLKATIPNQNAQDFLKGCVCSSMNSVCGPQSEFGHNKTHMNLPCHPVPDSSDTD